MAWILIIITFGKPLTRNWRNGIPAAMSDLFLKAGARYVVLVTKHHDGFCMWPTDTPNPNISDLFAKRDVVGELSFAVKERGHEIRGLLFFII